VDSNAEAAAEEPVVQELDSAIQEEQPKSIFPDEENSEKEKNFRELKKLLNESKQENKAKITSTLEKKPVVAPRKKKKVRTKPKLGFAVPNFNIVKKMKGLFSKN
jgi:hypothetical protein